MPKPDGKLNLKGIQATSVAMEVVDLVLARIKKEGRGWQFKTKEQVENTRQELISEVVRAIMRGM